MLPGLDILLCAVCLNYCFHDVWDEEVKRLKPADYTAM